MNKLLKQTLVCAGTLLLSMQVAAKPSSEAKEVRDYRQGKHLLANA